MAKVPVDVWRTLTGSQIRLCEELAWLGKGKPCYVGRAYLARKLGLHVDHISRLTSKLASLGVLRKFQRCYRRQNGGYDHRPCVYTLAPWAVWKFCSLVQAIFKRNRGLTFVSDRTREKEKITVSDFSFVKNEGRKAALERFAKLGRLSGA